MAEPAKVPPALKEYTSFGVSRDRLVNYLLDKNMDVSAVKADVYQEILSTPDFYESAFPTMEQWKCKSPPDDASETTKMFFVLRDRFVDWDATVRVALATRSSQVVMHKGPELGYGRSPSQNRLGGAMLFWSLNAAVRTNFPTLQQGFGNFFIPVLDNFRAVTSTGSSEVVSDRALIQFNNPGADPDANTVTLALNDRRRVDEMQRGIDAGSYGAVYRGLPIGESGFGRSVAIRVERSKHPAQDSGRNTSWIWDGRLMLYICHLFETYRQSDPLLNNFCPRFRNGCISQTWNQDAASARLSLITVHDYWDGTLDTMIMFEGDKDYTAKLRVAPNKNELVALEIARIKRLSAAIERFAISALAMADGSMGKYRVEHGDFKMNNIVVLRNGEDFILGIIDYGMAALYEIKTKDGMPPKRVRHSTVAQFNTPDMMDPFLDFSYLRYTIRVYFLRWAHDMLAVAPENQELVGFVRKLLEYLPFKNVLHLTTYYADVSFYAGVSGRGWIYRHGMGGTDRNLPSVLQTAFRTQNLPVNDYYSCEAWLLDKARGSPLGTEEQRIAQNRNSRWKLFVGVVEKKKTGTLRPTPIE